MPDESQSFPLDELLPCSCCGADDFAMLDEDTEFVACLSCSVRFPLSVLLPLSESEA